MQSDSDLLRNFTVGSERQVPGQGRPPLGLPTPPLSTTPAPPNALNLSTRPSATNPATASAVYLSNANHPPGNDSGHHNSGISSSSAVPSTQDFRSASRGGRGVGGNESGNESSIMDRDMTQLWAVLDAAQHSDRRMEDPHYLAKVCVAFASALIAAKPAVGTAPTSRAPPMASSGSASASRRNSNPKQNLLDGDREGEHAMPGGRRRSSPSPPPIPRSSASNADPLRDQTKLRRSANDVTALRSTSSFSVERWDQRDIAIRGLQSRWLLPAIVRLLESGSALSYAAADLLHLLALASLDTHRFFVTSKLWPEDTVGVGDAPATNFAAPASSAVGPTKKGGKNEQPLYKPSVVLETVLGCISVKDPLLQPPSIGFLHAIALGPCSGCVADAVTTDAAIGLRCLRALFGRAEWREAASDIFGAVMGSGHGGDRFCAAKAKDLELLVIGSSLEAPFRKCAARGRR